MRVSLPLFTSLRRSIASWMLTTQGEDAISLAWDFGHF